jgi:hypothetical protein
MQNSAGEVLCALRRNAEGLPQMEKATNKYEHQRFARRRRAALAASKSSSRPD